MGALGTEYSRCKKFLRYFNGQWAGLKKRSSRLCGFDIYRASRYVKVPPKRDWDVENVTSR